VLISRVAIQRPVFTTMVIGAMIVFGFVSLGRLGVDLFPRVDFPVITIVTKLPGADPETVETRVTDPIEESVNTLSGVKRLRSTSADSFSLIQIEFELDKNVDVAFQEVQARVNAVRQELPTDVEEPVVEKFDIDAAPILTVVVSADLPVRELSRLADKTIRERLQRVQNVGSAKVVGKREREIWLWLNPDKLKRHNLSVQDLRAALQREHVETPGGRVETGPLEFATRTKAEFQTAADFNSLILIERGGRTIRLRDVGFAEDGLEEERSYAQLDAKPCIALQVRRQSGTNTVQVARDVKAEVERLRQELGPRGVRLEIAMDTSTFIERSVREVEHHLTSGGAMAIFTVLIFLLNFRSTFISALVLPTSVLSTFMLIYAAGFTLNMMTLLGLTLAIGLLIDDAIVVQENISRHVQEGKPPRVAAEFATSEIGLAVLAATLSVVAVFMPVAMTKGIVGRFFWPFALTISCAVLVSMFISFTLDPMMSSRLLKKHDRLNFAFRALEWFFQLLERLYGAMLGWALRHRLLIVAVGLAAMASVVTLAKRLQMEFVPMEDRGEFNVMLRAPQGASLDRTRGILEQMRTRLRNLPEIRYTFYTIGADELQKVNEAQVYVRLNEKQDRTRSQAQVMEAARDQLKDIQDAQISVQQVSAVSGGGMKWAQVQYEVRGRDLDTLEDLSNRILAQMRTAVTVRLTDGQTLTGRLQADDGQQLTLLVGTETRRIPRETVKELTHDYVDTQNSYEKGKPEADILVDRARAAELGVSPRDIADTVRASIGGSVIGKFKAEGDRYDIAVRFLEQYRNRPGLIAGLWVPSAKSGLVELRNVAHVVNTQVPIEITRYNRERNVTVLSNLGPGKVLGPALGEIRQITAEMGLPSGYTTGLAGQSQDMEESFHYLFETMILSVIVVYMVLAAQFESFIHPFTIMLSLPLAFVGALAALLLAKATLSIFTMIGFIFLLGLVTKNAILLIDYTNTLRERDGVPRDEALRRAGPVRLRPILMTSVSTVAGMLPTALGTGSGAETRQPMALAVVGGLITSTLLTLLVVPAVYSLLDPLSEFMKRRFLDREQPAPAAPAAPPDPNTPSPSE
jgi:hydrophobic/amphiphilic exporter-1 (mainly G- bacteria), HAE1 family